jgi:hypothetical protein
MMLIQKVKNVKLPLEPSVDFKRVENKQVLSKSDGVGFPKINKYNGNDLFFFSGVSKIMLDSL